MHAEMDPRLVKVQQLLKRLPAKKVSIAGTLLLLIYIAYQVAQLVWLVMPEPNRAPINVRGSAAQNSSAQPSVNTILAANLFGKAQEAPKEQPKTVVTDAPQTRLSIRLTGVVSVESNDQAGLAIIESQGHQETYAVGDVIKNTRAKVHQVVADRVILNVSGRFETLMLDGIEFSRQVAAPRRAEPVKPAGGLREVPAQTQANNTLEPTKNEAVKRRVQALREELKKDPQKLFDVVRFSPKLENGRLAGYQLRPGKEAKLFREMGLKSNDLAVAINGYSLTDATQARTALANIMKATSAKITVQRDSQQIDVLISLD